MARVKRSANGRKHRKAVLEQARGTTATGRARSARRTRPSCTRATTRSATAAPARASSAGCGSSGSTPAPAPTGISYSRLIAGLDRAGVEVDRRVLADLAVNDDAAFGALVEVAAKALAE